MPGLWVSGTLSRNCASFGLQAETDQQEVLEEFVSDGFHTRIPISSPLPSDIRAHKLSSFSDPHKIFA